MLSRDQEQFSIPNPMFTEEQRQFLASIPMQTLANVTGRSVSLLDELKVYLRAHPGAMNEADSKGHTLLYRAVILEQYDCAEYLLRQGAKVAPSGVRSALTVPTATLINGYRMRNLQYMLAYYAGQQGLNGVDEYKQSIPAGVRNTSPQLFQMIDSGVESDVRVMLNPHLQAQALAELGSLSHFGLEPPSLDAYNENLMTPLMYAVHKAAKERFPRIKQARIEVIATLVAYGASLDYEHPEHGNVMKYAESLADSSVITALKPTPSLYSFFFPLSYADSVYGFVNNATSAPITDEMTSAAHEFRKVNQTYAAWLKSFIPGQDVFEARKNLARASTRCAKIAKKLDIVRGIEREQQLALEQRRQYLFPSVSKKLFLVSLLAVMGAAAFVGLSSLFFPVALIPAIITGFLIGHFGMTLTGSVFVIALGLASITELVSPGFMMEHHPELNTGTTMNIQASFPRLLSMLPIVSGIIKMDGYRNVEFRSAYDIMQFAMNPARWANSLIYFLKKVACRIIEVGSQKGSESDINRYSLKYGVIRLEGILYAVTEPLKWAFDIPPLVLKGIFYDIPVGLKALWSESKSYFSGYQSPSEVATLEDVMIGMLAGGGVRFNEEADTAVDDSKYTPPTFGGDNSPNYTY